MKKFNNINGVKCCKTKQHSTSFGKSYKYKCNKLATHTNGSHYFCRHHSKSGRYVVRNGDVGEIIARFDTEQELRKNIFQFPGMQMQKITKSQRKNLF